MNTRGSALIETLAIGFLVTLVVGQCLVTAGRIAAAGEAVAEAAWSAATVVADAGDSTRLDAEVTSIAPEARVTLRDDGDSVTVVVEVDVSVVGPSSGPVTIPVRGWATVTRSPYRSGG